MAEVEALAAMASVERNPVRAGGGSQRLGLQMVLSAGSCRGCRSDGKHGCLPLVRVLHSRAVEGRVAPGPPRGGVAEEWFREATRRGLPPGPDDDGKAVLEKYGRDLSLRPVGRPGTGDSGRKLAAVSA